MRRQAQRQAQQHRAAGSGGAAVSRAGDSVAVGLDADAVLDQVEAGVVVADRQGNLQFANSFAMTLFGLPDEAGKLAGH